MNLADTVQLYLRQFLTRTFTLNSALVEAGEQLQRDLGLSEWEFTEAIVYLETLFGVILPDAALNPALTVGQLCHLVARHESARAASLPALLPVPARRSVVAPATYFARHVSG